MFTTAKSELSTSLPERKFIRASPTIEEYRLPSFWT